MKNVRALGRAVCAVLLFAVGCALGTGSGFAQNVSGSITGTVKDSTGATVAGASVQITDVDHGQNLRTLTTNGEGFYTATALPIGNYTVKVDAKGFKTASVEQIVLHVNDALTINPVLSVGSPGETVTVTADTLQLNFENSTQAGLINGTQVRELVLNNRNYEQLVALQPGVAYSGGDSLFIGNSNPSGQTNVVNFSVNGGRTSGNNWTVDGADNVDRGSNFTLLTYPSVDAIAEFKTLRATYSAEFGRSASGQINVVTKSGSNDLHGSAYEFIKNDIFNANQVLNKLTTTPSGASRATSPRGKLRYNDFGYTVGGPIFIPGVYNGRQHKSYFFFSQELRRIITYNAVTLAGVPSLAERQGTFAANVCANVNPANGNCSNTGTRQITNISPLAQAYLKDIYASVPAPDSTGTLITAPLRNLYNANQQIVRIDQGIGEKLNVFFRFINDSIPTEEPGGLFQGVGYPGVQVTDTNAPGRIYLGHLTYVFTPTLLVDGGYAFSQGALLSDPVGTALNSKSPDVAALVKLPFSSTLPRVPALTFTGGTGITTYGPYRDYSRNHNIFANVTKTVGTHTLHFGVNYNHYNKLENNAGANAGSFAFTAAGAPTGSTAQSYQQSFANFLTGNVTTFTQASYDVNPSILVNQIEFYGQDDWKIIPRLTLNLGVRHSKFGQPTDGNHQLTTFDPALYVAANAPAIDTSNSGNLCLAAPCTGGVTPNPKANLLNGISINIGSSTPATSRFGAQVGKSDNLDFAPRVGFALDVFGNGKTSLRGGYGIAFDSALFGTYEQNIFQNKPFVQTPTISNTSFDNPAAVSANVSLAAPVLRATSPNFRTPYVQQFSLGLQQALPWRTTFEASYVGNEQVHLIGLVDINQAAPGAYIAAGLGAINTTTVGKLNQIRPYRGYSVINSVEPIFMGNYHSLQLSLNKQFAHDSLIQFNYTLSKALTNANADRTGAPQISSQPGAEYGRSAADRRHIFNFNTVYALPFFFEQRGFVGHLLGGWEVSAIGFFNSGLPLNLTTTNLDPAGVGVVNSSSASSGRPDRVGDPNSATGASGPIHTRLHWFNITAFTAVPAGQIRGGNAKRNIIEGPGWWRVDPGLFRNVRLYDRLSLQLRAEAQNVFNHTNPDTITTAGTISPTGNSSTVGNISGYRDKRILQFGAKVTF